MMMTVPVIAHLTATVLGLTPLERLDAARKPFDMSFVTERWFAITMMVALLALIALFLIVSYKRAPSGHKASPGLFDEYADKSGLSERERQILQAIAGYAELKESEAIFTTPSAFDRGGAKMVEESQAWRGSEGSRLLKIELSYLREKLGLQKQRQSSIGSRSKPKRLSSRQIPAGRTVRITRRTNRSSDDIEATVVGNNDIELTLKMVVPVRIAFGEAWRVHYYFGASVWEFDTSVVSYDGDILVLNHSDNVRFINRRRFLRVPVSRPAFIAPFPFAETVACSGSRSDAQKLQPTSTDVSGGIWGPPEFVSAVVTELAGPGLRVETALEVNVGDRVLMVFQLDAREDANSSRKEGTAAPASKVVQDIGEVRHIKAVEKGFSVAVELVGLSDQDVDELVRATNAASLKAGAAASDTPAPAVNTDERAPEPSVVQGA
jgi:hypothetical protein